MKFWNNNGFSLPVIGSVFLSTKSLKYSFPRCSQTKRSSFAEKLTEYLNQGNRRWKRMHWWSNGRLCIWSRRPGLLARSFVWVMKSLKPHELSLILNSTCISWALKSPRDSWNEKCYLFHNITVYFRCVIEERFWRGFFSWSAVAPENEVWTEIYWFYFYQCLCLENIE